MCCPKKNKPTNEEMPRPSVGLFVRPLYFFAQAGDLEGVGKQSADFGNQIETKTQTGDNRN